MLGLERHSRTRSISSHNIFQILVNQIVRSGQFRIRSEPKPPNHGKVSETWGTPDVRIELTTTGLKVLRSTTELIRLGANDGIRTHAIVTSKLLKSFPLDLAQAR